uniref:Uncharacterized protein n=1 Tax=Romanomermis culicivorax TaxID=13658 RepID=A0A915L0W6_ROMCU
MQHYLDSKTMQKTEIEQLQRMFEFVGIGPEFLCIIFMQISLRPPTARIFVKTLTSVFPIVRRIFG